MYVFTLSTMMWFQDIGFHDQNNNSYCKQEIK
jgi:N-acetylglutamate synthase-like GNAT family acetyltransferase